MAGWVLLHLGCVSSFLDQAINLEVARTVGAVGVEGLQVEVKLETVGSGETQREESLAD